MRVTIPTADEDRKELQQEKCTLDLPTPGSGVLIE
jgi:hypothetical protein